MSPLFELSKISAIYVADFGRCNLKLGTVRVEGDNEGLSFEPEDCHTGMRVFIPGTAIRGYEVEP